MSEVYVFDTSAWIGWWHEIYPIRAFPDISKLIQVDVDEGRIVSPVEVKAELEEKMGDALTDWVKERNRLFVPARNQSQDIIAEISNQCPKLLKRKKVNADPAVVAWALQNDQTVVTQENHKKQTGIVACCRRMGVACRSLSRYVSEREMALDSIRKSLWGGHH